METVALSNVYFDWFFIVSFRSILIINCYYFHSLGLYFSPLPGQLAWRKKIHSERHHTRRKRILLIKRIEEYFILKIETIKTTTEQFLLSYSPGGLIKLLFIPDLSIWGLYSQGIRQVRLIRQKIWIWTVLFGETVQIFKTLSRVPQVSQETLCFFQNFIMCVFQCQPTALLRAPGSAQGG